MAHRSKKRKTRPYDLPGSASLNERYEPDSSLFIQAFEADLVRGPSAYSAARSLEVLKGKGSEIIVGDALIQWNAPTQPRYESLSEHHLDSGSRGSHDDAPPREENVIWVDRYDARLLLEALPDIPSSPTLQRVTEPSSPGGWSDLPSDAEDTFFFSAEEAEDYRRDKRRRTMDRDREARLKALRAEAGADDGVNAQEEWGGSDEEPEDAQRELMRRTAAHLLITPNPAQLEMRILANHGADQRFAFLRGRWSRAWRLAKGKARLELEAEKTRKEEEEAAKKSGGGMGGLAGYGDSDEEGEDGGEGQSGDKNAVSAEVGQDAAAPINTGAPQASLEDDDPVKAARRARAREWAEKRRAAKESSNKQEKE
ncbi:hypothetical protein C8Q74DRAFT_1304866 [Fomes fomentarius]|nr:hypothetical protein C8Q74DRAFT_1304866 [Fomes fomentarius]